MGYSRAVRVGRHVFVAGTCAVMPNDADPPSDAYGQARRCLEIIVAALAEAEASPDHVVRTRMYVVDGADWEGIGRAHAEGFGDVRPARSLVVVPAILDPHWVVGIEADGLLPW